MNTMKIRLLLVAWLVATTGVCLAQNGSHPIPDTNLATAQKPVVPRGSIVLADMKARNPYMFSQYQSAKKKQRSGIILTGIGGGLLLAGAIVSVLPEDADGKITMWPYVYETDAEKSALRTVGVVYMVGGAACLSVGLPLMIVGGKKKKQTFQDFKNQYYLSGQPSPYFQINVYPNRVGVAYMF